LVMYSYNIDYRESRFLSGVLNPTFYSFYLSRVGGLV
jgi:hypothetical protein